jgi:L-fuculose-phosphate aldolase
MVSIPEQIAATGKLMFERRLTDMAGGNISVREGHTIYISPKGSGSIRHWQLTAADIISGEMDSEELLNNPNFSREGKAHLAIYRHFPEVGSVIHAHSFHIQPFVSLSRPIEPVLEQNQKFGVVIPAKAAPAHSQALADNIVEALKGKEGNIRKQAAAVIIPTHGIIVAGKDLLAAIDALERIDWNAWCIISRALITPEN